MTKYRLCILAVLLNLCILGSVPTEQPRPCGAQSLHHLVTLFGIDTESDRVKPHIKQLSQKEMASFADITSAAEQIGLDLQGMKMTIDQLQAADIPTIVHFRGVHRAGTAVHGGDHLAVAEKVTSNWVRILDNSPLPVVISRVDFMELWSGKTLILPKHLRATYRNQLVPEESIYDFGVLQLESREQQVPLSHTVSLKNQGHNPIRILAVQPDCNCTIGGHSGAKLIMPGEKTEVQVEWIPNTYQNQTYQNTEIRLLTDQEHRPVVFISLTVDLEAHISVVPGRLYIERFDSGSPERIFRIIEFINPRRGTVYIQDIAGSSQWIEATADATTIAQGQHARINVSIDEGLSGKFSEHITISYSIDGNPETREVVIPVEGEIGDGIQILPKRFFFGVVDPRQAVSRTVRLRCRLGSDLKILKAEASLGEIRVLPNLEPEGGYLIQLALDPPLSRGIQRGNVTIHTNLPSITNIPVFALVTPTQN